MSTNRFPYKWTLAGAGFTKDKGKVFSCFACGGGSTMGYKLAGFDVIGCNEIDPRMNAVYVANHHPKYNYLCDIRHLVGLAKAHELPEELYNLDILDGSPPCSSFCVAGDREEGWGKKKKFREGQVEQVLDMLFFDFIDLVNLLRPKIVIAENVKGLTLGNARAYMTKIYQSFDEAGYAVCHHLLDAGRMGVPQRRERVFFAAIRKDLLHLIPTAGTLFSVEPVLDLRFNEPMIPYGEFADDDGKEILGKTSRECWEALQPGDLLLSDAYQRLWGKRNLFTWVIAYKDKILPTFTAHQESVTPIHKPKFLSRQEQCCGATFPQDYDFAKESPYYICGMSVPPVMMAQVASRVYEQWLSKIQ